MATLDDICRDLRAEKITRRMKPTTTAIPVPPPPIDTGPQYTIDDVVAKIIPPFAPLRDKFGVIHDNSTVAVRCQYGHIHKYPVERVLNFGVAACTTCSSGPKFDNYARRLLELTLGVPFAICSPHTYYNPALGITLACSNVPADAKGLVIRVYETKSEQKLLTIFREALRGHPPLTDEQLKGLGLVEKPLARSNLPYSPALAELMGAKTLDVEDDDLLYFERCK